MWLKSHQWSEELLPDDVAVIVRDNELFKSILSSISIDMYDAAMVVESNSPISNPKYEIFEQSLFYRFPIWRIHDKSYVISDKIFEKTITYFLFEKLSNPGKELSEEIGHAFERYVETLLHSLEKPFWSEDELRQQNSNLSRYIDFLTDEKKPVLIECKGILAPPLSKGNPTRKILENSYQDSLVKAILQGYSFTKEFKKIRKRKPYFLIVTLENLFFGKTSDVWEEFLGSALSRFYPDFQLDPSLIDLDRIFIISIEELEALVNICIRRNITLGSLLDNVQNLSQIYLK